MKRVLFSLIGILSFMAFAASCEEEMAISVANEEKTQEESSFVMNIVAGNPETKTVVEQSGDDYLVKWKNGDKIAVYEVANGEVQEKTISSALSLAQPSLTSTFTLSFSGTPSAPYDYSFVSPSKALDKSGLKYRIRLNKNQTFSANTFDPEADILLSEHIHEDSERPASRTLSFARIGATARMILRAPSTEENINKITLSTTEGNLSGLYELNPADGSLSELYSGDKEIVLTPESTTTWSGDVVVWFRCAAITLNNNFTVSVRTNSKTYTKEIDLDAASREIQFVDGKLTKFSVNMAAVEGVANPSLTNGWYVLAAKKDDNYYALSSEATGSRLSKVDLPAAFDPSVDYSTSDATIVWKLTNTAGYITLQTPSDLYLNSASSGASTSGSSQLFALNEAVIGQYEVNTVSPSTHGGIRYNASSSWWGFYTSAKATNMIGDIYFVPADVDKTPVLTIDDIDLAYCDAASNVEIIPDTKKFISDITVNGVYNEIGHSSACTWATVVYEGGVLKYSVLANNDSEPRIAYVRVTGNNGEGGSQIADFTITQPGKATYSNQWVLVTDVSDLEEGDKIVIVNTGGTKALSTTQNDNNRGSTTVTIDNSDSKVVNITNDTQQLVLGKRNSHWTMYTGTSGYLYAASSSNNYLKTKTTLDTNCEWTFTLNASFEATIEAQGSSTHNLLKNNGSIFSCYESGQTAVKIYKLHPDTTPRAIDITTPSNGTVSTSPETTTTASTEVTITATPNSGYAVSSVSVVDGASNSVTTTQTDATHYTFIMPASDVTVTVTFARLYTISTSATNGTISVSPSTTVLAGETITITASPSVGYTFSSWSVTGATPVSTTTSPTTFVMPASDVTVSATFESSGGGGSSTTSTFNYTNIHSVRNLGSAYTTFGTTDQTITVDGMEITAVNLMANNKNQPSDGATANSFVQMKNGSYLYNTTAITIESITIWSVKNAPVVYLSTLTANPTSSAATVTATGNTATRGGITATEYSVTIPSGTKYFNIKPSGAFVFHEISVTYTN